MIKCEIRNSKAMVEAIGTLDDITCDILVLVSSLYEKMQNTDAPMMASLFRDGLKKAFAENIPFGVVKDMADKMISHTIIDDVMKDANDIFGLLDEFSDYIKKRSKKNDKGTKD